MDWMFPRYGQPIQTNYYSPPYQRPTPIEAQTPYPNQYDSMANSPAMSYLKGRPVVSIEEARAAQIDLDGSLFVFTDIANNKIYTKQVNLDGIAVLKTYSLVENSTPATDYVTRGELESILAAMRNEFTKHEERNAEQYDSTNGQQLGTVKKPVREQPSF